MGKKYVKDISDCLGDVITEKFLLTRATANISKDGKEWISCIVSDITGKCHAKIWSENINPMVDYQALVGKVVLVEGYVDMYDGECSLAVRSMNEADEYDIADYAEGLSQEDKERCVANLNSYIDMVEEPSLKALLDGVFKYFLKSYLVLPAGKAFHHSFNGALLVHTLEVCDIAYNMGKTDEEYVKRYTTPVNMDLLIAGALLHDVGKVVEYTSFPNCERTLRGTLTGHLTEGVKCINAMNAKLKNVVKPKMMNALEHIILSSHGGLGGGLKPMIKEAIIIKNADMMSAEVDAFDCTFKEWDDKHQDNTDNKVFNKFSDTYAIRRVL